MIKRFFILLLAIVASVGMGWAQDPGVVSSGTKGGMSYTFYDNGLLEISGSGALPGNAFTNSNGGFGASVKNIRFAEDCEVYGLDYMWFACYTQKSQLETIEINSVAPIMFTGASGAGIFYKQDGAVTLTITAPGIVDVENEIIDNYGSPVNMIFNMPATTVFEKKWFSSLENNFAVTIPTGAKGHIPAGYSFKDSHDQQDYDHFVEMGHEADFWKYNGDRLTEGVDYTLGVESTFVITAENASQIFGQATVSFKAPTEASNSEWVLWRKSDLKTFPDMSSGDQKVCKDITVKVNNGVYDTDSGWGLHFESKAEDGVQFVAPEGKVFKRIVILNEYGTFSDPNWSYDKNYKKWSGSANTVGFVGNICGISLIEFELDDLAPVNQLYMEVDGTAGTLKWGLAGSNPVYDGDAIQYSDRKYITTLTIDESCQNHTLTSFYNLFHIFKALTTINGIENLATANVENMSYMFYDCQSLTSLDLSSFNTANVTNMKGMFNGCSNLTTIYVGDGWNTSAVTNGGAMFYGCTNLPNYDSGATGVEKAYVGAGGYLSAMLTPADVMALINAIGTVELTAECKAKIDAARTAYDALSTEDKALVTNTTTLTKAETDYAALAAAAAAPVIAQIEALPTAVKLSTYYSTYDLMVAARAAYNALSAEVQAAVTNLSKLTDLEAAYAAIGGVNEKLSKPFSVGAEQVVYFSHGNLQATYNGTNWSWALAAHQYDYIGDASGNIIINGNGTLSGAGTVDLFGWVANSSTVLTSGVAKYGVSNSDNVIDYGLGTTETLKGDWGVAANDANIGGYNDWRILSNDEWVYLFKTRTDAASKYGYATVGGKIGVIIIPDAFTDPMKNKGNLAFRPQNVDKGYSTNIYTTGGDWEAMEAAGAVFMPAAGRRAGTTVTINEGTGFYWSSTPMSYQASYFMGFMGSNVVPNNDRYRYHGLSVRLVSNNAPVAVSVLDSALVMKGMLDALPSTITLEDACVKAINDAREAYNKLSEAAKGLLDAADVKKLTDAETALTTLNQAEADKVIAKIAAIPSPVTLKLATRDSIESARDAYEALTAEQKALVPAAELKKLTDAEADWAALINVAPAGALSGKYTINAEGDVIYFAHGNLQYTRENLDADWSTGTFRLATNQYDLIEEKASPYCTDNYGDKTAVGLFGWGTWGEGQTPNLTSHDPSLYTWTTDFVGTLEGNNNWRTLSKDEWSYLLTHNNLTLATVHGVHGLLVAPNDSDFVTKSLDSYDAVTVSDADWTAMEAAGVLFLPAAGQRYKGNEAANIVTGDQGEDVIYWSSTPYTNANQAYNIWYAPGGSSYQLPEDYSGKRQAFGVRLVSAGINPLDQVQVVKGLIDAIPAEITLDAACVNAIQSARAGYDALDTDAKAILDAADVKKLTDAEAALTALNQAEANKVIAKINEIPSPMTTENTKLSVYQKVQDARAAYDALTAEQKALVEAATLKRLTDAEDAFAAIGGGGGLPTGALTGVFSVGKSSAICFSQGNLQATTADLGASWTWSFAANQWDFIGNAVANTAINDIKSVSTNGTIDLFGWSTAATYYGISNNPGGAYYTGDFIDWGTNAISNGGNTANAWHTLAHDEWDYLFNTRTTTSGIRYAKATVNGIPGIILLPDDWSATYYALSDTNDHEVDFNSNVITTSDWTNSLEANGAVFLPAAGYREGTDVKEVGSEGHYWSSTFKTEYNSYCLSFKSYNVDASDYINRREGYSVRLVVAAPVNYIAEAQAAVDLINAIPDPVTLDEACVKAIKDARAAVTELGENASLIDAADMAKLTDAEQALKDLNQAEADKVIAKIALLPNPVQESDLKLSVYQKVQDARAAYDALTADQKLLVTNYDVLTAAEAAFNALPPVGSETVITWDKNTGIEEIGTHTTTPAYEGITLSTKGGLFGPYGDMLRFYISISDICFEFANTLGANFSKIVLSSTSAIPSTRLNDMGEGWVASNDNKIATWTGDAATVKIWNGISATSYWDVNTLQFTLGSSVSPIAAAQAAVALINAIPSPVTLDEACVKAIKDAREAVTALGESSSLIDAADVKKLTDAEIALTVLNQAEADKVIAKINNIPSPVTLKLATRDSIESARAAYDALTADQKPLVSNYTKLTDAEAALADLNKCGSAPKDIVWDSNTGIEIVGPTTTSPAYEGMTVTVGKGSSFSGLLEFTFYNQPNGGFIFANENGTNITKVVIESTTALTSTMTEVERMGSGWVISNENKTATWTGNTNSVSIWKDQSFASYWVVDKITFTVNTSFTPLDSAQAVKDLIEAIPTPVEYPTSGPAIAAALVAYNQLSDAAKSALDADDVQKMTDAAAQYAALDAIAAIEAIPAEITYDPLVKAAIETARKKYDELIDASKALVEAEVLQKLTNAEQAWAILVAKIEHNVSYIGKDGEIKNEKVALLNIPDPAPELNGFEFDQWIVKAGDFLKDGLSIKASYNPIITTKPAAFDTLVYNGTAQTLIEAGVAKEGHIEYRLNDGDWSTELPKADMAAAYAVYYKLVREAHDDYIADPINVTIAKAPVAYTAPAAYDTLVYNATNQTLIAAGQTNDGTLQYSFDPTLLDSWSAELPQAMAAGTYDVYYRVKGDLNHVDSVAANPIAVTIAKAELTATADDKDVIYGDAVPTYTVTYAGWQGEDNDAVLSGKIAFACDYTPTSNVGIFAITPSGVSAANYDINFVNGKVTVAKADPVCTAPVAYDTLVYNGIAQTLIEAGVTAGGEIQYSLDTTLLGSWNTTLPQTKDAGAYKVFYRIKGDNNHNDRMYKEPVAVSIAKAALMITANNKNVTYGDSVPAYDAAFSGLQGEDTDTVVSGLAFTCEYAPTSNVAEYTITPNSATAANYNISYTNGKVTVGKAALMITAEDKNVTYGDAVPAYTATYSGWKNSDDATVVSNLAFTCTYAPTSNVGEYTITPNSATATNYAISYTNGKVTVAKAALMITAEDKNVTYGDAVPAYTATYSGWKNSDDATVVSNLAFTSAYAPTSNVGEYTITPNSATAANYAISYTNGKVTVAKAALMITAEDKNVTYGDSVPEYTVTYSGWKNSDDASVVSGLAYTCEYAPTSNVGEYTITPNSATATNYDISYTNGKVTVGKAALMITAEDKNVIYGDAVPAYTATYSGWKNSDDASVVSNLAYTCAYAPTSNVAEYTITPNSATATNYAISYTNGKVTVGKAALMITAEDKNVIYGDAVPAYTATYSGWKNSDDASVVSGLAYTCAYAPTSNVGEYTITPNSATAANYAISYTNGKVTVAKAALMITAEDKNVTYGDSVPEYTVTYSGWKNSDDATVVSNLAYTCAYAPTSNVGEYTITPNSATATNYAISYTNGKVTVGKAALMITAEDKNVIYGDAVPTYTATYSGWKNSDDASVVSNLAYTCEYAPTSNVGEYTITPNSATATNYAISYTNGKVTVGKAALMITAEDKNVIYGDAVPAYTATYSGWKNSDDASVVSNLAYTCEYAPTSSIGEYTITPNSATATNYDISYTNGKVTVAKAVLTITANDTVMIYGDAAPVFTASYSGWLNNDDETVVSGLAFTTPYQPGSPIGTYTINPNSATAQNYQIVFVDGKLTVNKAIVEVKGAQVHEAKFADGHAGAEVTDKGTLNGVKLNDPLNHITTASFSSAEVSEHLTITLFYELTGDAALLNNYDLQPTSEIFTTEGVIIEPFHPDTTQTKPGEEQSAEDQTVVQEGIEVYAYGYCKGDSVGLKYHLNSGNPDQYKIDFADSILFKNVDWTDLDITGPDGVIYIDVPVNAPTGDYQMTVYFRDSRFTWLESQALNVTFHVNLPETYVKPLFDNTIVLVDTCDCFTDIQWYYRETSSDPWAPIPGATGHYYRPENGTKLTGEYFVSAKMNGVPTYTCGQEDMETLYGAENSQPQAQVSAYPNPVESNTNVTIKNSTNWTHDLRVVNLMGIEVLSTTFEGDETIVNMDGFVSGNYMISVDGITVKVMKK